MTDRLFDRTIEHFKAFCQIPHGSGDMDRIAAYCVDFAKKHTLKYRIDEAKNVIIYKDAAKGYEGYEPILLQGHLDMVCQAVTDFDFLSQGITVLDDGDYLTADGTTLGADNGIAVAMIFAILESNDLPHPAIEAVFTTDEEIGMIGASQLDVSALRAKKMINLDSEEEGTVTVSCAGGMDFTAKLPATYETVSGALVKVTLSGLKGGHSGVEIDKNRVNANILAGRLLSGLTEEYRIISINGGNKGNAIPNACIMELCTRSPEPLIDELKEAYNDIKAELAAREDKLALTAETLGTREYHAFSMTMQKTLVYALLLSPNGIIDMSAEISGLVETSLNLGILKTESDSILFHYALRSNKNTALLFLSERLNVFYKRLGGETQTGGYYPPWEYQPDSTLQALYTHTFRDMFGHEAKVEAIHAGLECAVFSANIKGLDCISIGPDLFDVHTVNEKLSLSSTRRLMAVLIKMLENCRF